MKMKFSNSKIVAIVSLFLGACVCVAMCVCMFCCIPCVVCWWSAVRICPKYDDEAAQNLWRNSIFCHFRLFRMRRLDLCKWETGRYLNLLNLQLKAASSPLLFAFDFYFAFCCWAWQWDKEQKARANTTAHISINEFHKCFVYSNHLFNACGHQITAADDDDDDIFDIFIENLC